MDQINEGKQGLIFFATPKGREKMQKGEGESGFRCKDREEREKERVLQGSVAICLEILLVVTGKF